MYSQSMSRHILIIYSVLSLASAFVLVVGCGSDSRDALTQGRSQHPLTRAQFIKQGDAICAAASGEQLTLGIRYAKAHPGAEEEDAMAPAIVPPLMKELAELEALPAPKADEAQITAFLEDLSEAVEKGKANPRRLVAGQGNLLFAKANKAAEGYGFRSCANNP